MCHLKPCLLRVLLQLQFGVVVDRFCELLQQDAQQKSTFVISVRPRSDEVMSEQQIH